MDIKKLIAACPNSVRVAEKKTTPKWSLEGQTLAAKLFPAYDGDSVDMATLVADEVVRFSVRVKHIDTPEMRTKDPVEKALAEEAKRRLREMTTDKVCVVVCGPNDKYGRVLADVYLETGESVADVLLREKLAFPYEGQTKNRDWVALSLEREKLR